jgi:hypothetical protein
VLDEIGIDTVKQLKEAVGGAGLSFPSVSGTNTSQSTWAAQLLAIQVLIQTHTGPLPPPDRGPTGVQGHPRRSRLDGRQRRAPHRTQRVLCGHHVTRVPHFKSPSHSCTHQRTHLKCALWFSICEWHWVGVWLSKLVLYVFVDVCARRLVGVRIKKSYVWW